MSPSQTSALNSLSGYESADGSTILNTMQQIVGALSTALATSFLELGNRLAAGSSAVRFTNGLHFILYFTLVIIIIGLILTFKLKDER